MTRVTIILIVLMITNILAGCGTTGNYKSSLIYRYYYDRDLYYNPYYSPWPRSHDRQINLEIHKPLLIFPRDWWDEPQSYRPPQTRYRLPNTNPPIRYQSPDIQTPSTPSRQPQVQNPDRQTPYIQAPDSPPPKSLTPSPLTPRAPSTKPSYRSR